MLLAPFQAACAGPVPHWRRAFPGRPGQARVAREFVAALLGDRPDLDEIVLVVGELVANALRHSRSGQGGEFTLEVLRACGRTVVSVTDGGGPAEPTAADPSAADPADPAELPELPEHGRGLRTVARLAESWGWHGNDRGRTVSAVFAAEPYPPRCGGAGPAPYGTHDWLAARAHEAAIRQRAR